MAHRISPEKGCLMRWAEIFGYMILAALICGAFIYIARSCYSDGPDPTSTPTHTTIPTRATATATRTQVPPTLSPTKTDVLKTVEPATPAATDDKTPQPPQPTKTATPCPWCYPWTGGCVCHQDVERCLCNDPDNHCSSCEIPKRDIPKWDKGSGAKSDLSNTELDQQSIDPYPGPIHVWTPINPYPSPGK